MFEKVKISKENLSSGEFLLLSVVIERTKYRFVLDTGLRGRTIFFCNFPVSGNRIMYRGILRDVWGVKLKRKIKIGNKSKYIDILFSKRKYNSNYFDLITGNIDGIMGFDQIIDLFDTINYKGLCIEYRKISDSVFKQTYYIPLREGFSIFTNENIFFVDYGSPRTTIIGNVNE